VYCGARYEKDYCDMINIIILSVSVRPHGGCATINNSCLVFFETRRRDAWKG